MRLLTDGAEFNDLSVWDYVSNVAAANTTPAPFASAYYYEFPPNSTGYKTIADTDEFYFRYRAAWGAMVAWGNWPAFRHGATPIVGIGLETGTLRIAALVGGSQVAVSTTVPGIDQWYEIEAYFKIADAPNGRIVVYIDNAALPAIDFTGDTKPGADTHIDNILFSCGSSGRIYVDDIAMNNTDNSDGKNDNSWVGDGVVVKAPPSGNGTTNDFTGSDGNQVDNYLLIDEFPHNGDTDFVYHDASISGHQEQYTVTSPSFTNKTIRRIFTEARARKTAALARTLKLGFKPSGGIDQLSAGRELLVGDYRRIVGDEHLVNPVDSGAWEEADIAALEIVAETG